MTTLHPDLARIDAELRTNTAHARQLADSVDDATWVRRPAGGGWSMSECLMHLVISDELLEPKLEAGFREARGGTSRPPAKMRRDLFGWMLSRMLEPPVHMKTKTIPAMMPRAAVTREESIAEFEKSQAGVLERVARANDIDATAIKIASPFNGKMKYSIYSAFCITTAHQRRHLWQMEQVRDVR